MFVIELIRKTEGCKHFSQKNYILILYLNRTVAKKDVPEMRKPVNLLQIGSTTDVFLGNLRIFPEKEYFTKK